MLTNGIHLICELSGCTSEILADLNQVEASLHQAAIAAGATILNGFFHQFNPQGVTGFLCLAESHISIHTWPEHQYAAVDIYTCGTYTMPKSAMKILKENFHAKTVAMRIIERGLINENGELTSNEVSERNQSPKTGHLKVEENSNWYVEDDGSERHAFNINKLIVNKSSRFQEITILQNSTYGKILFLDGSSQSAQSDEYIYHETLVHPAMLLHPNPERVLILGGGEGASLREVLKHNSVKEAVMVDIDGELVTDCRKHLPEWSDGAFEDPRTHLVIADGKSWVENQKVNFDVIIMDLTDQIDIGPSFPLYTEKFFLNLRKRLKLNGILVVQSGTLSTIDYISHSAIRKTLANSFGYVRSYLQNVPSFFSEWSFILASNFPLSIEFNEQKFAKIIENRISSHLKFYGSDAQRRMFTIPSDIQYLLNTSGFIVKDRESFLKEISKQTEMCREPSLV